MSRALSGAAEPGGWGGRERTLVQAYPAGGGGVTDRGTWKKRSPPKNLEVWAVEQYPGNDSGLAHVPKRQQAPLAQVL